MVKCLIRIKTKVNVHLRMINHCYRDVRVRVLTLGPRLLGNVLGALPILPSLPNSRSSSGSKTSSYGQSSRAAESLHDSGISTPLPSLLENNSLASYRRISGERQNESQSPVLPTLEKTNIQEKKEPVSTTKDEKLTGTRPQRRRTTQLGKIHPPSSGIKAHSGGGMIFTLAWIFLVSLALLLALLLLLVLLTESQFDLAFLNSIRENPEFQRLHYTYFCPLRRWLDCTLRWMGDHLIKK